MKSFIIFIAAAFSTLGNIFSDHKVNFWEAFEMFDVLKEFFRNHFKYLKNYLLEWQTASGEQRQEWISEFQKHFDLPNDKVEALLERIISTLALLFSVNVKSRRVDEKLFFDAINSEMSRPLPTQRQFLTDMVEEKNQTDPSTTTPDAK